MTHGEFISSLAEKRKSFDGERLKSKIDSTLPIMLFTFGAPGSVYECAIDIRFKKTKEEAIQYINKNLYPDLVITAYVGIKLVRSSLFGWKETDYKGRGSFPCHCFTIKDYSLEVFLKMEEEREEKQNDRD